MTARFADTPLDSVTAELEATLERVKTALETHCEDPEAPGPLGDIIKGLRDVRGACVLLERHEAAQQAGELLGWAERLAGGETEGAGALRERLLESVLRLSRYLAWRHRGQNRPEAPAAGVDLDAIRHDAAALRPRLQRTLLGLLRGDKLDHHLDQLATTGYTGWSDQGRLATRSHFVQPARRRFKLIHAPMRMSAVPAKLPAVRGSPRSRISWTCGRDKGLRLRSAGDTLPLASHVIQTYGSLIPSAASAWHSSASMASASASPSSWS